MPPNPDKQEAAGTSLETLIVAPTPPPPPQPFEVGEGERVVYVEVFPLPDRP
jgi:hypothetical protein